MELKVVDLLWLLWSIYFILISHGQILLSNASNSLHTVVDSYCWFSLRCQGGSALGESTESSGPQRWGRQDQEQWWTTMTVRVRKSSRPYQEKSWGKLWQQKYEVTAETYSWRERREWSTSWGRPQTGWMDCGEKALNEAECLWCKGRRLCVIEV